MKMIKDMFLAALLFTTSSYSLQTGTENVNPFSKFSASSSGVNEYSGAAMTSLPITSISGVNVQLNYSSNVTVNARSDNSAAPAGWCGLGWQLGFGSIRSNHKNTAVSEDDEFYWVSPDGTMSKLLKPYHLQYSYFQNYPESGPDLPDETVGPHSTGTTDNIKLLPCGDLKPLFLFQGDIEIPNDGTYTFFIQTQTELTAACKSVIFINDEIIVSAEKRIGIAGEPEQSGSKYLQKGTYRIKVVYRWHAELNNHEYEFDYMENKLEVRFSGPNISKNPIPTAMLYYPGSKSEGFKKYYVADNPMIKFEPQDLNMDGIYDGWIVTNPDGKKYMYGNLDYGEDRSANRYIFQCGEYVGCVTSGTPSLYPYQWDLSAIRDITGNEVGFYYQQEKEPIHSGPFKSEEINSSLEYTKASYIERIENWLGEKVKFTIDKKPTNEMYDPDNYVAEPDGFMEMYESSRLTQIEHYLPGRMVPAKTYKFEYGVLNDNMDAKYRKSLLTQVKEYNGGSDERHLFSSNNLQYYSNIQEASEYDSTCNYGALKSILTSNGAITEYNYSRKSEINTGIYKKTFISSEENFPGGEHGMSVHSGIYDNNKEYIITQGHPCKLSLFYFDGCEWKADDEIYNMSISGSSIYTFDNTFIVVGFDIYIFYWYKGRWLHDKINLGETYSISSVHVGNDFIVLRGGDGENTNDQIWLYRRIDHNWVLDEKYQKYWFSDSNGYDKREKEILTGKDFFVVRPSGDNHDEAWLVYWDGKEWHEKNLLCPQVRDLKCNYSKMYAGSNYVVFVGGNGNDTYKDFIWVYYWDGSSWKLSKNICGEVLKDLSSDKKIVTGNGYFLILKEDGNSDWENWVVTWDGVDWQIKLLERLPDNGVGDRIRNAYAGPDYFIITGGNPVVYDNIRIYNRTNNDWVKDADYDWDQIVWPDGKSENYSIVTGKNSFAISIDGRGGMDKVYNQIYSFDGSKWKIAYTHATDRKWKDNEHTNGIIMSQCASLYGYGFATNAFANTQESHCDSTVVRFVHKFQDNFDSVRTYTVSSTEIKTFPQNEKILTEYKYSDSHFDAYNGILKFNKVETINNTGKTVNYYYNSSTADDQQTHYPHTGINYKKFDGLIYKTETYDKASVESNKNKIGSTNIRYDIFQKIYWPDDVYFKRVKRTEKINQGVKTISEIKAYNEINGLPNVTIENFSSDWSHINKEIWTKYAIEDDKYKDEFGVNNKNMLNLVCQSSVCGQKYFGSKMFPLSASATTYKKDPKLDCWLPYASYSLKVDKDDRGCPPNDFVFQDFNHSEDAENANWKFIESTSRYGTYGMVEQTTSSNGLHTSIIRRCDNNLKITSIPGAKFTECGVFTGDYNENVDSYFDKENGWYNNQFNESNLSNPLSIVCEEANHFGCKGVKVQNAFGPTRNFKLEKGRNYILSAWVKIVSGDLTLHNGSIVGVDYRKRKNSDTDWPIDVGSTMYSCNQTLKVTKYGDWYYIELPVNASTEIPKDKWNEGVQYARAWVGVPNGDNKSQKGTAVVYIDDIRFYPENVFVSSTYYDPLSYSPIVSIDANNKPGQRISYDQFGRPVLWQKYDLSKATNANGYLTTVMKKEYHQMGYLSTSIYSNDYESGIVDFDIGPCGNAIIVANGYNSSNCLKIENCTSSYKTLIMNSSLFSDMCYILKGYYRADQNVTIKVMYKSASDPADMVISTQTLQASKMWAEFNVFFDLSQLTMPISSLSANFEGGAYNMYLDNLNIGYIE